MTDESSVVSRVLQHDVILIMVGRRRSVLRDLLRAQFFKLVGSFC
jgi:hypothetical protein